MMMFFDFHAFTFMIEPDSNKEIYVPGTYHYRYGTIYVKYSQKLKQYIHRL